MPLVSCTACGSPRLYGLDYTRFYGLLVTAPHGCGLRTRLHTRFTLWLDTHRALVYTACRAVYTFPCIRLGCTFAFTYTYRLPHTVPYLPVLAMPAVAVPVRLRTTRCGSTVTVHTRSRIFAHLYHLDYVTLLRYYTGSPHTVTCAVTVPHPAGYTRLLPTPCGSPDAHAAVHTFWFFTWLRLYGSPRGLRHRLHGSVCSPRSGYRLRLHVYTTTFYTTPHVLARIAYARLHGYLPVYTRFCRGYLCCRAHVAPPAILPHHTVAVYHVLLHTARFYTHNYHTVHGSRLRAIPYTLRLDSHTTLPQLPYTLRYAHLVVGSGFIYHYTVVPADICVYAHTVLRLRGLLRFVCYTRFPRMRLRYGSLPPPHCTLLVHVCLLVYVCVYCPPGYGLVAVTPHILVRSHIATFGYAHPCLYVVPVTHHICYCHRVTCLRLDYYTTPTPATPYAVLPRSRTTVYPLAG